MDSPDSKKWFVYILRCRGNVLYTGCTTDVPKRVATHRAGQGARFTRSRLPVKLIWQEEAAGRSAALRREAEIKRWPRPKKIDLIKGRN